MGYPRTHLAVANVGVGDRFFADAAMHNGAYAVANGGAMPTEGARHITCVVTQIGADDTMGTLTVVGRNLAGETITEILIPLATGAPLTGAKWFRSVTSIMGATWARDAGAGSEDTIIIGCGADTIVAEGYGTLHGISVNTTSAGTITLSDASGTIGVLAANITEGLYLFDANFGSFLQVALGGASDITILHSGSMPQTYALA